MPYPPDRNSAEANERISQRELASTEIRPPVAKVLSIAFCVSLLVPALTQVPYMRAPQLDEKSPLKQWIQPRLQTLLTQWGGFGNEQVTVGHDGWLFYAPGLRYASGQPFLSAEYLAVKRKAMIDKQGIAEAFADPLPAFHQFARDCQRLGIRLLLVPVPDKGSVMLLHGAENSSFGQFRQTVTSYGAEVLPVQDLIHSKEFLRQDTHWTPAFMDRVARAIAERIGSSETETAARKFELLPRRVSNTGDLVAMLKLPAEQKLFQPETLDIEEVRSLPGASSEPNVLLVGDSFTNIYSSQSLGWGERAGLGEHLSFYLNAPVDIVATNGGGSSVRQELLRAARSGRLRRIRTLVYEFAVRDLYTENWPPVALGDVEREPFSPPKPTAPPSAPPSSTKAAAPPSDNVEITVAGTLTQISRPIDATTAAYDDALVFGKVKVDTVEAGRYGKKDVLVAFVAMRKRTLLPGNDHKAGERLRLKLLRLNTADEAIRGMQRSDDTRDFDLVPYLVQSELPR